MNLSTFDSRAFSELLEAVGGRSISFHDKGPGVLMRHDVDADIERSVKMAQAEYAAGVRATYFILNTAAYWFRKLILTKLRCRLMAWSTRLTPLVRMFM